MGIFTGQMVYREQIQKKYGEPMLSELDNIYASFSTALKDVIKTQQSNVSDTTITTITNNVLNQIGTGSKYYDLSISEVTVENTTVETAVYTKTVDGGTLSSGKLLKINLQGLWERFLTGSTNATGSNLAVKVTFGGTVVISGNIATGLGRVDDQKRPHTLEIWVSEVDTNTQRWLIYSNFGSGAIASATWYTAPYGLATSAWMSSTAKDTSADQVLAILITHSQQDNTLKYVKQSVLVESVNASASTTPTVSATAGGTGYSSFAVGDILYADTTTSLAKRNVGSAGQILRSNGTNPAYSTLTIPDTVAVSTLLYASSANVLAALATANSGILVTSGTGVPSIATDIPTAVTIGTAYIHRVGGTDVVLADGGTSASLTASVGGIFYSTATAGAILAGTATAGQIVRSGASAAPTWSTATYPATVTVSRLLYASAANVISDLTTANDGTLITSGTGVPSISSTLPTAVQDNITRVGTLVAGSVPWSLVNKTGSSLADLTTRSAGALSSGNLAYARMPTGFGTWDVGAGDLKFRSESGPIWTMTRITTGTGGPVRFIQDFVLESTGAAITDGFGTFMSFSVKDTGGASNVGRFGAYRRGADNTGVIFIEPVNAGTFYPTLYLWPQGVLSIGSTVAANPPTTGSATIVLTDGIAPSGMATNTAGLYADNVGTTTEMFAIDELGASTQISPHGFKLFEPDDIEPYPWSYYSKNEYLGVEINVDICKLARLVQNLTGQQLIYHNNIGGTRDWVDHQEYNMRRQMKSYEQWEVTKPEGDQAKPPVPQLKQPPLWLKKRLSARGLLNVEKAKALATALTSWKQERHL